MPRKKTVNNLHGWLCLDKPVGITSTACVGWMKRLFKPIKVGHGGTLDPLANGILPIAFGEATKTSQWAMDARKTYEFSIAWGEARTTLDAEGDIVETSDIRPNASEIQTSLASFVGRKSQLPPKYSAIKVNGNRAYDLARSGESFDLTPREVILFAAEIISHDAEQTKLRIVTGKGYYVRSLARDLAVQLGCCGYVKTLTRTGVGRFDKSNSISPEMLEALDIAGRVDRLLPLDYILDDLPVLDVSALQKQDLINGRAIKALNPMSSPVEDSGKCLAKHENTPVALGLIEQCMFQPKRVFNFGS